MKSLLVFSFFIISSLSHGQLYSDTISYKTGLTRYADIIKISNTTINYKYLNEIGREMTTSVRISMLDWYTMDGERDDLEPDFNASNLGYEDTLYLKNGEVRYARIDKETKVGYQYEYVNNYGKISKTATRKALLNRVIIGDKKTSVAEDFESPNPTNVVYDED